MDLHAPLVFREIKYGSEGVVDEEGEPVIEPKPAKPSLLSRAKAAMSDNVSRAKKMIPRDAVKQLAKALGPVRDMMQQWKDIEAAHKAKCDTSAYTKYLERMQAKCQM